MVIAGSEFHWDIFGDLNETQYQMLIHWQAHRSLIAESSK